MLPLVLIPVHNEADSLPSLIEELRESGYSGRVLVVDDGSTDDTRSVLGASNVRSLRLHQRVGVGGAVRAGLRYALLLGYDTIVRIDGDGQHPPDQIEQLLKPIERSEADAVLGSRHLSGNAPRGDAGRRFMQRMLAVSMSALSGHRITDPTSGFWAFGPAAVRMLAQHHPTGYPEPELLLFLRRNGLRIVEVPVDMRARVTGQSSLTVPRTLLAIARVLMALLIVPLRQAVKVPRSE